jgi:hypothetical protein
LTKLLTVTVAGRLPVWGCATLLGLRYSYEAMGRFLHVRPATVKQHVEDAARKIAGDLPAAARVACCSSPPPVISHGSLRCALCTRNESRLYRPAPARHRPWLLAKIGRES